MVRVDAEGFLLLLEDAFRPQVIPVLCRLGSHGRCDDGQENEGEAVHVGSMITARLLLADAFSDGIGLIDFQIRSIGSQSRGCALTLSIRFPPAPLRHSIGPTSGKAFRPLTVRHTAVFVSGVVRAGELELA